MRQQVVLGLPIILVGAVFFSGVFERKISTTRSPTLTGAPQALSETLTEITSSRKSASLPEGKAFRFTRELRVKLGTQNLAEFKVQGVLWARKQSASIFEIALQVESPREVSSSSWYRVHLDDALQIRKIENGGPGRIGQPAYSPDLARLGEDLLTQYFFFQKRDLQGSFEAEIVKKDDFNFEKYKIRYTAVPYSKASIGSSLHALVIDASGVPETIQGLETITLGERDQAVESRSSYVFKRDHAMSAAPWTPLASLAWSWSELPLLDPTQLEDPHSANWAALEGVGSLPDLLLTLKTGHLKTTQERLGLFRKLVKRMNSDPAQVALAASALDDLKSQPRDYQILVGALASTSIPEAHQALQKNYADPTASSETKNLILNAWIATDATLPSGANAFVKSLLANQNTSPSERQGAWLALGSQVSKLPDSSDRAEIEALLIERIKGAQSQPDRIAALEAVGNSGSRNLLPYIRDFLGDPADAIRAKAFLALRRIPGQDILALITSGRLDPSSQVRRSVEMALNQRDPE